MDITTEYLGLKLKNPIVASSSPLSATVDGVRKLEDAGAAAIVLTSLFEEQMTDESRSFAHYMSYNTETFAEALTYFPQVNEYHLFPDQYLELISKSVAAVDVPVIASLNGVAAGGWIQWAKFCEDAGAKALELNAYFIPTDPRVTGEEVELRYLDILREVKQNVRIPVSVKLSPFFTSPASMAQRLVGAGADGLVLFNRFYQPDFDLEELEVVPRLVLSRSDELRLPLRWVAILYDRVKTDFAITSGVHTHVDVLKGLMAGAKVTMMTSELLSKGVPRITEILRDMQEWMEAHEYESVRLLEGSMSQKNVADPAAFERANYMATLLSWRPDPTGAMP